MKAMRPIDDDATPHLGRHGPLSVREKLFVSVLIIRCISHVSNLEVISDKSFGPVYNLRVESVTL